MERLAEWTNEEKTEVSIVHHKVREAMLRLAAYEDTGREPEEIAKLVDTATLKKVLKDTYLEIANNYSVSDLHSDGDKVSCVASKFRQTVLDKLELTSTSEGDTDGRMRTGWTPVPDGPLPEDCHSVMVCGLAGWMDVGRFECGLWWTGYSFADIREDIIAWMPLPEPYRPDTLQEAGAEAGQDAAAPVLQPET